MQVDTVLAWLERPYIVIFIVVVLLQMVGEIFVGESPNPTIAFARELSTGTGTDLPKYSLLWCSISYSAPLHSAPVSTE